MNNNPFSFRRLALDQGSLELTEEYIRMRAYQLYEQRGRQDGHDLEDWYEAESEIFGRKPTTIAEKEEFEAKVASIAA